MSNINKDKNTNSKEQLFETFKLQLEDSPEVLNYIQFLHKKIKKQRKKLKILKVKLKCKTKNVSTQTEFTNNQTEDSPKRLADEIKEAAELATQESGFIYDETSGMYYDCTTGYYYNAEYGLYYDSKTGIYMMYDNDTKTYKFHSQVYPAGRKKDKFKTSKSHYSDSKSPEIEDGECTQSDTELSDSNNSDLCKKWPPCIRIIVEETNNLKIGKGSLHIITCKGGTLGREGNSHAIILPDINISKCHLKFAFDEDENHFLVTDMGSRNGTILNGKRMSISKQESEPIILPHGSRIQIGTTILLCHIHEGTQTCGQCEPGLIQQQEKNNGTSHLVTVKKSDLHKHELKKLRKKFGINQYEENSAKLPTGYVDRAQNRRTTIGSQNPHEKTEICSLEESVSSKNKGFKMLVKMGWKEGESLGKNNEGMTEPIPIISNPGTSGIGNNEMQISNNNFDKSKQILWKKTKERFDKLPIDCTNNVVFNDSD